MKMYRKWQRIGYHHLDTSHAAWLEMCEFTTTFPTYIREAWYLGWSMYTVQFPHRKW